MSRFFRAKKKLVSLAGGSGAGRKIIKANLGDDGVVVLRLLKTVTTKLHGKKRAKKLKKNLLRLAVKCGYLFKNEILTDADGEGLKDPFERLCKQFMDATQADVDAGGGGDGGGGDGGGGGGESKYGSAASAALAGSDDDDDDDDDVDDDDDDHGQGTTATIEETLHALSPALRAHVKTISATLADLDACLIRMLAPHMKAKNTGALSSTVRAYADPVWLAFFLCDERCQGERVSAHSVFHNWYDRNFREAAERRAERAAQQRQFALDRPGFTLQAFLSNPRKQSYLAMHLKEAHGDRTSCQLWQAVAKLKTITNRKRPSGPHVWVHNLVISHML